MFLHDKYGIIQFKVLTFCCRLSMSMTNENQSSTIAKKQQSLNACS